MYEEKNIKILARFLLYIITLASVFLYGIINTYALETKTIYSVNNNGTLASANTYNYGYLTGGGTQATARANINTTISGKAYGFMFLFYENVVLNKTYTLVVNFMDVDLLKTFNSSMVRVATCNGDTCNNNTIVSVVKSNNYGNSNKLTIEFNPITIGSVVLVNLGSNEAITGISTFGIKSVTLDSTNQNQDIINNQTNNTNNIINNNNSNTQEIIDNQNNLYTSDCKNLFNKNIITDNSRISNSNGTTTFDSSYFVSDYIEIKGSTKYTFNFERIALYNRLAYYDTNKTFISSNQGTDTTITTPSNAVYIRFGALKTLLNSATFAEGTAPLSYCEYGSTINKLDEQTNAINDLNDSINDDDIGGATQDGADFILDFDTNTFGLTSIITAPLNLIESLTSSTCSELELPLPFLSNKKLKLPCMTSIYQNTFGSLFTMYQTITFGIIAYWVCVRIFNQVKDFKNPEHDEIEVVDL